MMVYVVQDSPGKNLAPAMEFGEINVMLPAHDYVSPESIVSQLELKLKEFNSFDWLLPMGDPIAIGIAFCIAAKNNGGRVSVLKWDKQERCYRPVEIILTKN